MLAVVVTWFVCVNAVVTGDKLIYLFGRGMPALSLILSMSMGFVPRFIARGKMIYHGQKGLGRKPNPFKIISILLTWALENAVETADSMTARGYGLPGRTSFGIYTFTKRDGAVLAFVGVCAGVILVGAFTETIRFRYFPSVAYHELTVSAVVVFLVYFALGAFPMILNGKEAFYWKRIASRV
jgi:energy-coupling factor transport system permease protein